MTASVVQVDFLGKKVTGEEKTPRPSMTLAETFEMLKKHEAAYVETLVIATYLKLKQERPSLIFQKDRLNNEMIDQFNRRLSTTGKSLVAELEMFLQKLK
jgi:hypothetical protein